MSEIVIKVENLWKQYRLGVIGHGALYKDLQSWWARVRGKEDPNAKIMVHSGPGIDGECFWALRDISLEVEQGKVLGIVGRNGAGKSTLLKILSRVTTPTKGTAKIKGRIASLLEVGTGFHPELTGRENIYLNGTILGMSKSEIKRKFDEIVSFSEVEKFIDTPVKRYSSGMYVRLAFAVAAHLEPEILVVDEVLAVGDIQFQKKCLGKMGDVARQGRTVLFVSHNLSAIRKLCHNGIVLTDGQITSEGTAAEAVEAYLDSASDEQTLDELLKSRKARNDYIDLDFIRVTDKAGEETKCFNSDETIVIEIGYTVKKKIDDLLVKLLFNDKHGNMFMATADRDYPLVTGYKVMETGCYVSKCVIPPDTFGTDIFYLDLIITKRKSPYFIDLRKTASFETVLVHSRTKNYGDMYGCPLRPHLNWTISKQN